MRLFIFLFITISLYSKISDYKIENFCIKNKNSEYKIIRSFKKDNQKYYLAIDTTSLNSTLLKKIANQTECKNSRLNYLLDIATAPPYPITNDGITHFKKGTFLTIDLCPSSKKGFEKRIFESLEKKFKNNIPLTIFLTKRWAIKHKKEFLYLKNNPSLNILWGNHTAYHHYYPKRALKNNFVLAKEENFLKDIIDNEIFMLNNNIVPSIFFRFPGLVSNKNRVLTLKRLNLIPIGANSWLAKGEKVKDGSIILIHGNKNEPKGVNIFLKLLKDNKITKLYPLNKGDI